MKRALFLLALLVLPLSTTVLIPCSATQPPLPAILQQGGYDLTWWTVDGGGVTFEAGSGYSLGGTAGQPDAGVLDGGGYTLNGGYWHRRVVAAVEHRVFLPLLARD